MVDLDEMICFCGSVTAGDIKAAVEAGQTAASRIGEVVSALVIPRPHASVSECMPELR